MRMDVCISEVLSFITGLLAGFGLKVVIDRSRVDRSVTTTTQKGNRVSGHQAGRDITMGGRESTE